MDHNMLLVLRLCRYIVGANRHGIWLPGGAPPLREVIGCTLPRGRAELGCCGAGHHKHAGCPAGGGSVQLGTHDSCGDLYWWVADTRGRDASYSPAPTAQWAPSASLLGVVYSTV